MPLRVVAGRTYEPTDMHFQISNRDRLVNDIVEKMLIQKRHLPDWVDWRPLGKMAIHSVREEIMTLNENDVPSLKERYGTKVVSSERLDESWVDEELKSTNPNHLHWARRREANRRSFDHNRFHKGFFDQQKCWFCSVAGVSTVVQVVIAPVF